MSLKKASKRAEKTNNERSERQDCLNRGTRGERKENGAREKKKKMGGRIL
jgi:hypothetical protein